MSCEIYRCPKCDENFDEYTVWYCGPCGEKFCEECGHKEEEEHGEDGCSECIRWEKEQEIKKAEELRVSELELSNTSLIAEVNNLKEDLGMRDRRIENLLKRIEELK